MKKTAAVVSALVLTLSMSATAYAENTTTTITPGTDGNPNPPRAETTVSFNVDPAYTVTIPQTVALNRVTAGDGTVTYEQDAAVSAEDVRLENGKKIQVALDSDYTMTANGAELPYTVTAGGRALSDENKIAAEFTTTTEDQSVTLHFKADNPDYAGNYSDTVTFTLSVVSSAQGGDGR